MSAEREEQKRRTKPPGVAEKNRSKQRKEAPPRVEARRPGRELMREAG